MLTKNQGRILLTMNTGRVTIITGRGDMQKFFIVAGAVLPHIKFKLQKETGDFWNFTGYTGTFTLVRADGTVKINAVAISTSEGDDTITAGEVTYTWSTAAPVIPGKYRGRITMIDDSAVAHPVSELIEVNVVKAI